MKTKVTYNNIFDAPVEKDGFSGGGHKRTAQSLIEAIKDFDGTDRAIGLEGNWGSGKSSVIKIAAKELDNNKSDAQKKHFHFFSFDLWRHQTNHFRRAFLEELIVWGQDVPGNESSSEDFEDLLGEVQNKQKTVKTESHGNYSRFGIAAVLFLLLLPLFYVWLSPFSLLKHGNLSINNLAIASFAMIILMIIWGLVETSRIKNNSKKDKDKTELSWVEAASKTLGIFSNKSEDAKISQEVRELDPTDFEFSRFLRKILALFQSDEKRLVFIFDNIDRLPAEKISNMWSELRSVFAAEQDIIGCTTPKPSETVTVIIPYDRAHVINALYKIEIPGTQPEQKVNEGRTEKDIYTQEDIFRKTFDSILRVSPPVLSDLSSYFLGSLNYSVGDQLPEETKQQTFHVFEERQRSLNITTTPRHTTIFINQIASLWAQWNGVIPLPTIAVFIAHLDEIDRDPYTLPSASFISGSYRTIADDPDYEKHLAGLAFNVEPDLAEQILMDPLIERAFLTENKSEKESEALTNIRKSHGFNERIGPVFSERANGWASFSANRLATVTRNLSSINSNPVTSYRAKQSLIDAFKQIKIVSITKLEDVNDLILLFDLCNSSDQAINLAQDVSNWLQKCCEAQIIGETIDPANAGDALARYISNISKKIDDRWGTLVNQKCLKKIRMPNDSTLLFYFIAHCSDYEINILELKPQLFQEDFTSSLPSRTVNEPSYSIDVWPQINHRIPDSVKLASITNLIQSLQQYDVKKTTEKCQITSLVYFLQSTFTDSETKKAVQGKIDELLNSWSLLTLFRDEISSAELAQTAKANTLWFYLQKFKDFNFPNPNLSSVGSFGNLSAAMQSMVTLIHKGGVDADILAQLIRKTEARDQLSNLILNSAKADGKNGLANEIISGAIKSSDLRGIHLVNVLPHYEFLKKILGDDIEIWLEKVGVVENEKWANIDLLAVGPVQLIIDIALRSEKGWKYVNSKIDKALSALTPDEWATAFTRVSLVRIQAQIRTRHGYKFDVSNFRGPFTDHLEQIIKGEYQDEYSWDELSNGLGTAIRKGIGEDLILRIKETEINPSSIECFQRMYASMFEALPLDKHPDFTLKRIILPLITVVPEDSLKSTLSNRKSELRKAMKNAEKATQEELQETLTASDRSDTASIAENSQWWRELLNIKAEPLPEEPHENQ